ncbi:TonB-linked outer membrane protein, SusC/RagA family [bacterium A37T11]|nr:TonB-linked outer membrane protein, SusC/RagA family [bacterium A37T11]
MRLLVLLLFGGFMQLSANTYAQQVTLRGKDMPFSKVLDAIRQQTDYEVMVGLPSLKLARPVSVDANGLSLEAFLKEIIKGQPFTYKIEEGTVILKVRDEMMSQKITLSEKKVPIQKVFDKISTQTGYDFLFSDDILKDARPISIEVTNAELKFVLNQIFEGQPLEYAIEDKSIVVSKKAASIIKFRTALAFPITVSGRVTDSTGTPLIGATIKTKDLSVLSDKEGNFSITAEIGSQVTISFIGYVTYTFGVMDNLPFQNITLHGASSKLEEVKITVNTGYQQLPKERATGSFDLIDNKILNRSVSTDILSRLDGIASGVFFNKNKTGNDPTISIRGRSTLFANTDPLIVLDNFPYDGDPNNINPNYIESITILKDAAAASIWGVRAGNGVIVLTTKKGKYNQKPKVSFNSNITISGKPNLYSVPQLSSAEFIELEKYLFSKGYYNIYLKYLPKNPESPVVDILDERQRGIISAQDSAIQLGALVNNDIRKDELKYLYRKPINQQYNISINGGGDNNQYYYSIGYDHNTLSSIPNSDNRITLIARNNYLLVNKKLEISTDLNYTKRVSYSSTNSFGASFPYLRLADDKGRPLVGYNSSYRQNFLDTAGSGHLLNWQYSPLDEINAKDNISTTVEYRANITANYKILKSLNFLASYQYTKGSQGNVGDHSENSYYVRNLINQYSQVDYVTGEVTRPIPLGDILSRMNNEYSINYGRAQLNFQNHSEKHSFNALAGFEIRNYNSNSYSFNQYGYDPATATSLNVNYNQLYSSFVNGQDSFIPSPPEASYTIDNVISYFSNAEYTYLNKYSISGSVRRDESNIFGVNANLKGVPLWSLGLSWKLSNENWFKNIIDFPDLRVRLTDGYNGNIIKSLSAYTTANVDNNAGGSPFGAPVDYIVNPPNPSLSWEKVHILNAGLDFFTQNKIFSGSIDFYKKKGVNLIGSTPIAPQTGVDRVTENTSSVMTKGIDLMLNTININNKFSWKTTFFANYVRDKILDNQNSLGAIINYVNQNYSSPMVGRPYSAIYSFPSGPLDNKGNPQGYLDGQLSENYSAILNSTNTNELKYNGPATPTFYGSVLNSFGYKNFSLSFNIIYKGGYYFRRGSYVLNANNYKQADYDLRWQKPGDETHTIVPTSIYPVDGSRNTFFLSSDKLVLKGDNVRLKDIQASYTITGNKQFNPWFSSIQIYAYVSNINYILWSANKLNLDPDFVQNGSYALKTPGSYSLGLRCNF